MKQILLESKAKNLGLLKRLGFNVPKFIVLSYETYKHHPNLDILEYVKSSFKSMYREVPSLISVRSSGSVSTPGRMKTILDVPFDRDNIQSAFNKVRVSCSSTRVKIFLEWFNIQDFKYSFIFQEMIKPSSDNDCTGVLISVNPYGDNSKYYAEFSMGKVGSDLMDGKETPTTYDEFSQLNSLAVKKLDELVEKLRETFEGEFELEFVIKDSEIHILQIRKYKVNSNSLKLHSKLTGTIIGRGSSIVQRGFLGEVTYDVSKADSSKILIIEETDYEDVKHMLKFGGIITLKGGRLSHASIIANQFDLNCVVGTKFSLQPQEGNNIKVDENGIIYLS